MRVRPVRLLFSTVAVAILLLLVFLFGARLIPLHVYDGFESRSLSWRWIQWRLVPGAAQPEQQIVRAGHQALALTVHSGDRREEASDTGAATERAEIMESWFLFSRTERAYVYSFSLYLPQDLPADSQRLVIAQWRQVCEARRCRPDNPVLAIRYQQGKLIITRQDNLGRYVLYESDKDFRGRWLDFRFVTNFSSNTGRIDGTLNGEEIIHYTGPTIFSTAGYPDRGLVYFKTGLYRDALNNPAWTIYADEFRKDQGADDGCK